MHANPGLRQIVKKTGRVLWQAAKDFQRDQCALSASALSLNTLFAIVPVMAMAFGIAKGFGFREYLENEVMTLFAGQEEIAARVLTFSNNLLEKTQGGLMAVLGILLLLYSLVKLMATIEGTFNRIWWVADGRSLIRKITDYLTISLAAGLLVILSGGVNIFVSTRLEKLLAALGLPLEGMVSFGFNLFPYLSTWILFILFYMIMPNKRVDVRAAAAGGVIAGTLFQFLQLAYLKFQVGVASYNAIYGSFAALPLFLIWLQTSWIVLLFGAEIAFEWENTDFHLSRDINPETLSPRSRKFFMLCIVRLCVGRFVRNGPPVTHKQLSRELDLPPAVVRHLLEILVASQVLFEVNPSGDAPAGYTPAMDVECMSIMDVLSAVERQGDDVAVPDGAFVARALEESLERFEGAARKSAGERKIKDI
ncbi:MAG: YihY/virulence factor BrkB family protein [Desulfobacter sp.]|nr:MAG: YihY/virulence factor BrkB family protein [Desulfobacter sp.]